MEMQLLGFTLFSFILLQQTALADRTGNCGWNKSIYLHGVGEFATVQIVDNEFGNNVNCFTQIEYSGSIYQSRHMQVEVDFFELNGSSATGSDCLLESERLTFELGSTPDYYGSSSPKSVTWCGQLYAEKHIFSTKNLKIIYNSGQIGQGRGFKLKISLVRVYSHSAITLKATEQPRLLYSPGYPKSYLSYWLQSVSLEGETGHYILIKILMIDLETRASGRCAGVLSIDNEYYCGTSGESRDILVPRDNVQISFTNDFSREDGGYILKYASYAVDLDYHNLPLYASSLDEKEVSAPPYLILYPSTICSWEVIPVPDPSLPDSSSLMLIVYGATPVDMNLIYSLNCANLTLVSSDGGVVRTFAVCPSQQGIEEVVYTLHSVRVILTLGRTKWSELPEPLFSYRLVEDDYEGDLHSKSSSSGKTGVAVGSSIASILFLLMVGAALAVFITQRRKRRHQQRQRNRREFLRNRREQRSPDDDNSRSPSVFIVGSMMVNTNSLPPPYRVLSETARGSFDSANTNSSTYYTNPDGGYTNSAGQFTENRRNGQGNGGAQSEYSELELPPPYHPLMPGSPHSTDEHFYHPLAATWDSGISDIGRSNSTLYSMAQSTGSVNRCGSEEGAREGPATRHSVSNQGEHGGRTTDTVEGSAEQQAESESPSSERVYATPSLHPEERQAPPSYEDANPPHPPPTYEVAMLPVASSENSAAQGNGRGQKIRRNGHLGAL